MRAALLAIVVLVAAALGTVEVASMALYGDLAQPPAVPALVPWRWGVALGRRLGFADGPAVVRIAYAQALLHRGDRVGVETIVATLPVGIAADDLRGQLAELRGEVVTALGAYARAGDFERAQRLIDARERAGALEDAALDERVLIDALTGEGRSGVRARALWRLGQIQQARSQALRDPARRAELERSALGAYDAALAIAPNEETYLLAAGQQALTLGDRTRAGRYYQRALDAVPDSADARAGLARAHP